MRFLRSKLRTPTVRLLLHFVKCVPKATPDSRGREMDSVSETPIAKRNAYGDGRIFAIDYRYCQRKTTDSEGKVRLFVCLFIEKYVPRKDMLESHHRTNVEQQLTSVS